MIVRIATEGQFNLPGAYIDPLNDIDNELVEAVEAGDRAGFSELLGRMLALVREHGTPVPVDELVEFRPDAARGRPDPGRSPGPLRRRRHPPRLAPLCSIAFRAKPASPSTSKETPLPPSVLGPRTEPKERGRGSAPV